MFRFDRARTFPKSKLKVLSLLSRRPHNDVSRRRIRLVVGIGTFSAAALVSSIVVVPLAQAGGTWNSAVEVPGSAVLNVGGNGEINSISCPSVGNCSAIGTYGDTAAGTQAFVVDETNGTWSNAEEIPGYGALNVGDNVGIILDISCSSPGNCGAGGSYADSSTFAHAFTVNETNGTWGSAVGIPGFASTDSAGTLSELLAISCSANGDCSAGGTYGDGSGNVQPFVVDESNGTWGNAQEVPGVGALNTGNFGFTEVIDCSSPGNCGVGGTYTDSTQYLQAFVANETNGTWGAAQEVPGSGEFNADGGAGVVAISCNSAGNCGLGGAYIDSSKIDQSFVADERNGTWGSAEEVTGVNSSGATDINSLVCTSPGNCSAGGGYNDASNLTQSFVMEETNGLWQRSIEVPNTSLLNASGDSEVSSVACSAVGYCSAGGYYTDASHNVQAFVVNESAGSWGNALEVPGTSSLNATGSALTTSLSCSPDGGCTAGGTYQDASNNAQAFVDSAAPLFSVPKAPLARITPKTNGTALVTITNGADNGGSPITEYQYSLNGGTWVDSSKHARTSFTVPHLKVGTTYRLAVRAVNIVGTGAASAHKSFKIV